MKIISWNVRGLGNTRTFLALKDILREHKPHILFICETKLRPVQMTSRSKELGFDNCFNVSRNGMGGGLALMWSNDVDVNIVSYSNHHIDTVVKSAKGLKWRCTGIYGHPEGPQKKHTWTLLRRLAGLFSFPWLCFGDFNEILNLNEKLGGRERNMSMVANFKEAVNDCNLEDLGYRGYPFTWSNRRFGPHFVEERLDRFLGSKDWRSSSFDLIATNLNAWGSDHTPIMLEIQDQKHFIGRNMRAGRRIHYEDMWSHYEECKRIVSEEWEYQNRWREGNPVVSFQKASKLTMASLLTWSKKTFKGRKQKLKSLKEKLADLKINFQHYEEVNEVKKTENQIANLLLDEEVYWKQRSRANWLREGDKNTRFFHLKASARRKKNRIEGIWNQENVWIDDTEKIEREFHEYFTSLFETSSPSKMQIEAALTHLEPKVNAEMNEQLDMSFTEEEVSMALSQMGQTKAPGPDGLPAGFFQKHWNSVKASVIYTCLHILNGNGSVASLNHTHIVLIPKIPKPQRVTDFRPISLCNVIYRIVAKVIANRLKNVLNHVISPFQSAFIPNRLITDNIIVGYECLHKLWHGKGKKHGWAALKLDISKAYDRVEWDFLKCTMLKLGFSSKLVLLIMNCITTASFSVVINGMVSGLIQPQRGLRQGCPLSPYLFILCAEVFSNLLMKAEEQKCIQGLRFGKDLTISHLLFADDSLIFVRAAVEDCRHLKEIFECYGRASGQIFNYQKSSMFFSNNTRDDRITAIKEIFQLEVVSRHEKYLGLPSMIGRKAKSFFTDVKHRVLNKIQSWQHKFFSSGGKEVLIKAVAQAIPAYAMSVFKIPLGLCEDIQRTVARFWWGTSREKKGIHWAR